LDILQAGVGILSLAGILLGFVAVFFRIGVWRFKYE
jgi:hypothetical protein